MEREDEALDCQILSSFVYLRALLSCESTNLSVPVANVDTKAFGTKVGILAYPNYVVPEPLGPCNLHPIRPYCCNFMMLSFFKDPGTSG